jgi:hypothetical protein
MKIRTPILAFWGAVLIASAFWVRFGIGNESWTNWMMGGAGLLFLVGSLTLKLR